MYKFFTAKMWINLRYFGFYIVFNAKLIAAILQLNDIWKGRDIWF